MRYSISNTAEYGDYITGPKIVTAETKKAMKQILTDIQDGSFAKEFLLDMSPAGRQVHFKAMRKLASEHPSEKVGKEIRKLYSWNNEDDKTDQQLRISCVCKREIYTKIPGKPYFPGIFTFVQYDENMLKNSQLVTRW